MLGQTLRSHFPPIPFHVFSALNKTERHIVKEVSTRKAGFNFSSIAYVRTLVK